jgi:hypothetical protein
MLRGHGPKQSQKSSVPCPAISADCMLTAGQCQPLAERGGASQCALTGTTPKSRHWCGPSKGFDSLLLCSAKVCMRPLRPLAETSGRRHIKTWCDTEYPTHTLTDILPHISFLVRPANSEKWSLELAHRVSLKVRTICYNHRLHHRLRLSHG